jgi:hypothetical protein
MLGLKSAVISSGLKFQLQPQKKVFEGRVRGPLVDRATGRDPLNGLVVISDPSSGFALRGNVIQTDSRK